MKGLLPFVILLGGCATSTIPLAKLGQDRDGSRVSVPGELHRQSGAYQLFHLCPDTSATDTYRTCIDLVVPASLQASLPAEQGACVVPSGRFYAFGPDRVGIGNYYSSIGYIVVSRVAHCTGQR
ncbi:hypothetical protein [Pseudoxanthomonas sp. CF385]|uniref:hypothetical protein n=1 Tax=Pseudoxanthomonas sp. CF385 TaxID=1881042 RepID=UPI000B8353FC|nr:hypothetical protein [Pseudoxanthomonas sp. CF385]